MPGRRVCKTCCWLCKTYVKSLSSASSTSCSNVGCSRSHSPDRIPRQMTASRRCRSSAVAKPHHEFAAYTSLSTMTALKTVWIELVAMPWELSKRKAWTLWAHDEMTLVTCARTESVFDIVMPRILSDSTWLMFGNVDGCWKQCFLLFSTKMISSDLLRLVGKYTDL